MPVTRFAPSPSGRLHLGHAFSAAMAADAGDGTFRLRIDDLDPARSRPEYVDGIMEDLDWLGLSPDGEVMVESERLDRYAAALEELKDRGLVYPCFCTRADIAEAMLNAPHGDPGHHYPGTCRRLAPDPARLEAEPHSWRLDVGRALEEIGGLPGWTERDGIRFRSTRDHVGDAILSRKDAPSSYHLACVLDDADQGVDMVVRGADLRPSTPIQRVLQQLLCLPEPTYFHHKLVTHEDGKRLAKRDKAPTLEAMRADGVDGPALVESLTAQSLPLGFAFHEPTWEA
ncbi:tRNA glutamyl-Q(34) synthetase GluQRS [Sphingomicrobium clamense]|uniref:tRNA glutamyl-Q(34) synthetase GluQRS n=1 Tax=Sphingomicrobium clamense TaxID=2851013 RepID=A0ABS6V4R7_9SPHN|nr:tRNA glutamyl-Q(34) synthetase GluQRS [Sphingomicrobium sp. B8]MBW0144083.1 tRNA glutamyl-Q(34) synthetase GluQRS [Sphingomicrobium sp. B8]